MKTGSRRGRAVRGSGSVRQRPDGRFELRTSIDGRRRSFMGHTVAEVQAKAADAREQGPVPPPRTSPTLEEWLANWLELMRDRLDPQTWVVYEQHARRHLVPAIGAVRLDALTDRHIDSLHRFSRRHVSSTTAHHVHGTLSSALSEAVRRGLIRANPAKAVAAPRRRDQDIQPYTPAQVAALLEVLRGEPLEALFVLAVTLGPREGELLGLRWRHIDLEGGRIRLVGNAVRQVDGSRTVADPKTRASARTLHPLPGVVAETLRRTEKARGSDLVWPSAAGTPLRAQVLNRQWHRLRERAGLPYATFHNLRHTAATIMLDDGVPVHVVSSILGHASVGITLQLYAHVTRQGLDAAAAAVDARYGAAEA